jgi:DNA invertase Pin-like site-specific DNA recombinase
MTVPSPRPRAYSYLRMSTDLQLKGDSRRRQLELSTAYADENDLDLVDGAQLEDIGISAFKGANVKEGALGSFLEAVKTQKVKPGSYLLVESLDRLSRQEVRKSLSIFLGIIDAGINIVTLADKRVYTAAKTEEIELITSLVIMSRAHEESRIKSQRVGAAWANKRANAAKRPLTATCPAWLKLSEDREKYEIVEEKAEVVRSIFKDTVSGIGNYSITRRLNQQRVPHFGKSNGWHGSYVAKILNNRAVIGEFQPHKLVDGKRQPVGEPIKGYFPAVIDEQLFHRAEASRIERLSHGRGRKGAFISNLFSGVAVCAYCKGKMKFENKGEGPKGSTFLVCDSAKRGLGCSSARWRYDQFEASFLAFVRELDLEQIIRDNEDAKKRSDLSDMIAALQGEIASTKQQQDRTYELFVMGGPSTDYVHQKLSDLAQRIVELEAILREKESELLLLSSSVSGFYDSREQIKSLIHTLQETRNDDIYRLRSNIALNLRALVSTVIVAPLGQAPLTERTIELLNGETNSEAADVIEYLKDSKTDPRERRRYFAVGFKNGDVRAVYPDDNDPMRFEEQVLATKANIKRFGETWNATIID